MSKVLEFFREREPKFNEVSDEKLTTYIGDRHPEFLQDREFAQRYDTIKNPPSLRTAPVNLGAGYMREMIPKETPWPFDNEKLAKRADEVATAEAAQKDEELQKVLQYHPLYQATKTLGRAGKVTLAAGADLAALGTGQPAENLAAYAKRPDAPMPVEEGLDELKILGDGFWSGAAAVGAKSSAALLRTAPVLGVGIGLGALGAPAAQANALAFGSAQEQGGFDPAGAIIAGGLPGVTKAGEGLVADMLTKLPTAGVVIEVLSKDPLKLKGKVVQKLGGMEISNDVFRKYLESGGGLLAANAYLTAMTVPQIAALPPEQRHEAALESVAVNLATSLSGFTSRKGPSLTLENMLPKLRAEWEHQARQKPGWTPQPRQLRFPAEEGAPVPPQDSPAGYNPFPSPPVPVVTPKPAAAPVPPPIINPPAGAGAGKITPMPAPPTTVQAQVALALDPNSSRAAVHVTPGEEMPDPVPPGLEAVTLPGGRGVVLVNPKKANVANVTHHAVMESHGQYLGFGNPIKPPGGEYVLQTRNAAGVVVQDELITDATLPAARAAALKAVPGGTSQIIPASDALKARQPTPAPPATPPPTGLNPGNKLADEVALQLRQGMTVDAATVRTIGGNLGLDPRQSGEWAELGMTEVARELAQSDMTNADKFRALVSLYNRMPVNGERTPDTRTKQQYSTPPPLAFVAALLADFQNGKQVIDPTAGHGMLLIGAPKGANLGANELDANRRERLARFLKTTPDMVEGLDATAMKLFELMRQNPADRVGQNPPFGNVLDEKGNSVDFPIINAATKAKTTKSIDIAIALNTFEAMTKDGKGFAIIGAKTGTAHNGINPDDKARAEAYRRADLIEFFQRFNVVDWFTVSGDLYRKMGAGWPVDVIVVHGKGKTPRPENGGMVPPWVKPPRVITTWDELEKLIPNANKLTTGGPPQNPAGVGGGGKLPQPRPGSGGGGGKPPTPAPGTKPQPPSVGTPPPLGGSGGPGKPGAVNVPGGGQSGGGAGVGPKPGTRPPVGGGGPQTPKPGTGSVGGAGPGAAGSGKPVNPKLNDLFGKLRGKLGGDAPKAMAGPGNRFDPEALSLAGQVANVYVEQEGITKFADFAARILTDAPDLWPGLKPYLHGAWMAAAMNGGLDEDISRADANKIIDDLENQPPPPVVAPPVELPPRAPEENLSLLVPYQPVSKNANPNLMVPRNIGDRILTALLELQREVGMPVDEFVGEKLGVSIPQLYKSLSAPQIDVAALMFRNIERNSALINSAQTGVGKGRTVAAAWVYARRRGMIPVIVTATKQLYTDMASRDLPGLGERDAKPYITDLKHYYVDGHGKEHKGNLTGAEQREQMETVVRTGQLPNGAHGIFTTYYQLGKDKPQGFKEEKSVKARRKRNKTPLPDGPIWAALRRLGPRLLLILDEAHEAAGETSDVGARLASILPNVAGVYYSSATFAKRPDNLNLYAMGTLMKRSGLNYAQMTALLKQGGVPLQQALTSMLAEAGEFIRQELDWKGAEIIFKQASANPQREIELADDYTSFLRDLSQLARQVNATAAALADDVNGERPQETQVNVSDIRFSSRLFNLSNQYLLALRAHSVVREAVAELKQGHKPFITVYNTMEGPISDLKARKLPLSFNGMLLREMRKMLVVKISDPMEPTGEREIELTPEQLPDGGEFYRRIESQVLAYDFKDMPISPLDFIINGVKAAGFSIGELSGRKTTVEDDGDDEPVVTKREDLERQKVLKAYNDGQLDALIGNASTGFSAHAAPEFKDHSIRVQITAQAAPDINKQMQIFGRSFRFGQVTIPRYIVLSTALAAERRFAMMLRGKMSGLNANTSADTESSWTGQAGFSADIFNSVGDDVVYNVMAANSEAARLADIDVPVDGPDENFARYATGKFVYLPNADAHELYSQIMDQYEDTIRILDEAGENPLRAKAEDLRARTLDQTELMPGTGNTPFDGPAVMERTEVIPPQKPMSHAEVVAKAAESRATVREQMSEWTAGSRNAEAERLQAAEARGATPDQLARIRENFQDVRDKIMVAFRTLGDTYGVDPMETGEVSFYGVPMELRLKGDSVADYASASRQQLIIGTNTYKRKFTIPLSKFSESILQEVQEDAAEELFDGNAESSSERYIITGNLLAGFEAAQGLSTGQEMGKPRVAIYTTHDGATKTGILMPPRWSPGGAPAGDAGKFTPLETAAQFAAAVQNDQLIKSLPGSMEIKLEHGVLSLPANADGRQIWGRPGFAEFFVLPPRQVGGKFVGEVKGGEDLIYLFDALRNGGARLGVVTPGGGTTQAMRNSGTERVAKSRGLHVKGFDVKPGTVLPAVKLGGMQHVRVMEMPELVRLAREWLGGNIKIKKPRGKAVAFFRSERGRGMIQMDPALFKNSIEAAQVMAHEIGHAYDWFDDKSNAPRGNLWGHIAAMNLYLRQTFGRSSVTSRELKEELIKLTEYWRPWDRAKSPPSFNDYRESPEELYADAMSVLFNSPGLLEQRAPKFYKAFWEAIDRRPQAKLQLVEIQQMLSLGQYNVATVRDTALRESFAAGETMWRGMVKARQDARRSWNGWWTALGQEFYWNFFPLEQRAGQVEKSGRPLAPAQDPRVFLDDLGYRDVTVMAWGRHIFEKVITPLEAAGLTLEDAGAFLFYSRIAGGDGSVVADMLKTREGRAWLAAHNFGGDRAPVANPHGFNQKAAQLGLLKMNLDLGLSKMTLLRDAVRIFHGEVFKLAEEAVEVGAYNRTTFETVIAPNKDNYATYAVLKYLDDFIPAGIRQQVGTLDAVANPFHATILKSIGLINLIAYQRAKNGTVEFLNTYYPTDLEPARTAHEPPYRKGKGAFMRLENGRATWYYTDPYIADAFKKMNPRQLWPLVKAVDGVFRKIIYPLIITYNPAFLFIMSPLRDVQRTSRNLPKGSARFAAGQLGRIGLAAGPMLAGGMAGAALGPVGAVAGGFVGAAIGTQLLRRGSAKANEVANRYEGQSGPLIREMEANLGLGTPFDQLARNNRDDFMADLLKRMRVMPDHELQGWYQSEVFAPVRKLLDNLELGGLTLDAVAKTSAYQHLRSRGYSPRQAAHWVRNNAGLPNINKKGLLVKQTRALMPFWNVATQGWRADLKNMSHPTTRAGWWFRYMATNGFLRVLLAVAATGALGAALKELLAGISEYDKTNYAAIPVGQTEGGEFGNKTAYLRVPEDETARLIGGVLSKSIRALGPEDVKLSGIFDFSLGQFPSFNPAVSVPAVWATYATAHNPIDPLRGRNIVPDREWDAGGINSLKPMAVWTINQSGVQNFIHWDPRSATSWELSLSAIPGVNKFIKVSDQGYREQQRAADTEVKAAKAREKLKLPERVQSIEMEYWRLAHIGRDARTPEQGRRYDDLHYWYQRTYRPAWEALEQAIEDKATERATRIRNGLDRDSAEYYRGR